MWYRYHKDPKRVAQAAVDSQSRAREAPQMAKLKRKEYLEALEPMQRELVDLARWVAHTGARLAIVFEGRDSAGKGGAIGAIREFLNPRQVREVALGKPTEREAGEWYFQRYIRHLPTAGEIVMFDRSWYNRAGVEKVMGFATEDQVGAFLAAAPVFEKLLTDDGIVLIKYWLCCDQAKQEERFAERRDDPLKGWKLSPIDIEARALRRLHARARGDARGHAHRQRAVDAGRLQRPEARPADADPRPARPDPGSQGRGTARRAAPVAASAERRTLQGAAAAQAVRNLTDREITRRAPASPSAARE
jgi:polyphosphate kinase 2